MTRAQRLKVRRLDVKWAHEYMRLISGQPFVAAKSEVNGKFYSADEVALQALHKVRTQVGTPAEVAESRDWLVAEGLDGLFGANLTAQ